MATDLWRDDETAAYLRGKVFFVAEAPPFHFAMVSHILGSQLRGHVNYSKPRAELLLRKFRVNYVTFFIALT